MPLLIPYLLLFLYPFALPQWHLHHPTSTPTIDFSSHTAAHAVSMPPGHQIAVDVDCARLFCCPCRDQVYDYDFNAAVMITQTIASTLGGAGSAQEGSDRKCHRVDYCPWALDLCQRALIGSWLGLIAAPVTIPCWISSGDYAG